MNELLVSVYRLASFYLDEFETAKVAFEKGESLWNESGKPDTTRKYKGWIRKCVAELESKFRFCSSWHFSLTHLA